MRNVHSSSMNAAAHISPMASKSEAVASLTVMTGVTKNSVD